MGAFHLTGLRPVASATAALAIITLLVLLGHGNTAYAVTFNPVSTVCLDDETTVDPDPLIEGHTGECDGDNAPGAATGITTRLTIPEGDSNFGALVSFLAPEWTVARDADVPDGALVGQLNSKARLGFLSNPCNNSLPVRFEMMDATTDTSTTVPFDDPEEDDTPADKDDLFGDEPDDQFDIGPDGLPLGVTRYPDYLLRVRPARTLDTPAMPVPIARMYGQTIVGGIDVSLNFLLFEPGVTLGDKDLSCALGYPSVTILQNLGDPDIEPDPDNSNAITDFCSPLLSVNTTYAVTQDNPNTAADEGGFPYRSNPPSDGRYNFVTWAESQIDTDNDGIENSLDPCPFDADPNWDPRGASAYQPGEDEDMGIAGPSGDGIPASCDPDPDTGTIPPDEDHDVYFNRADNCPLVANGKKEDNQEDSDFDGIGDACDTQGNGPNSPDGERSAVCIVFQEEPTVNGLIIGAGGGPAPDVLGEPCTTDVVVCEETSAPGTLTPGLSVADSSLSAAPGSSVTLTVTLADASANPRVGEEITFEIESQPGTDASLVFAGVPRLGDAQRELANLEGAAEVTKTTDASGTAKATLSTGSKTGQIVVLVEGGGETETITVTVVAGGPVGDGDAVGGAGTGVGALAPAASSVPIWAAIASGLGVTGILGAIGATLSRILRRRQRG